jgi:hypothetical protein
VIPTRLIADELKVLTWGGMKLPFKPGPEQLEYDEGDTSATVTRVPGGGGLSAEGTEETYLYLVLVRAKRSQLDKLEVAMDELDRHLLAIGSGMRWNTYIQFVDRVGDPPLPEYESPERVLAGAQYQIREGRE